MGYKNSLEFDELYQKVEDNHDFDVSDIDILFHNQGHLFSMLDNNVPCSLIPTTATSLTEEENDKRSSFLFSVVNQLGLATTFLYGTAIDPILYSPHEGKFKRSKFEPCEFLMVSDVYGEDESGRDLLMFTAKVAATCELPWFAFVGGAFKQEVLTTIVKTKESFQVPLLQVILQNRIEESVAKMSVPFFIDVFDSTTIPDKKLYKFSSGNEVQCHRINNELITDWRNMK